MEAGTDKNTAPDDTLHRRPPSGGDLGPGGAPCGATGAAVPQGQTHGEKCTEAESVLAAGEVEAPSHVAFLKPFGPSHPDVAQKGAGEVGPVRNVAGNPSDTNVASPRAGAASLGNDHPAQAAPRLVARPLKGTQQALLKPQPASDVAQGPQVGHNDPRVEDASFVSKNMFLVEIDPKQAESDSNRPTKCVQGSQKAPLECLTAPDVALGSLTGHIGPKGDLPKGASQTPKEASAKSDPKLDESDPKSAKRQARPASKDRHTTQQDHVIHVGASGRLGIAKAGPSSNLTGAASVTQASKTLAL